MPRHNFWPLRLLCLEMVLAFSSVLLILLVLEIGVFHPSEVALAQSATIRYVASSPLDNDNGNNCTNISDPCATIQQAVDVANPGDEIRVATGVYTYTQARAGVTQVVYIDKTVTIRGGYDISFTGPPNPTVNPTILNAQRQGRVLYIIGAISPTIEGLQITGGNAAGLGGGPFTEDFGGGVYVVTATVIMSNNQVFSNVAHARAVGEVGSRGRGGGAFFYNSPKTTLSHNSFSDNNASEGGGLHFYNSPTATLTANLITNNVADHLGGPMKHYGGMLFSSSHNATLIDNTISGNYAANNCGGVCFLNSNNILVTGNLVMSNTARQPGFTGNGAGLYLFNSKEVNLVDNTIVTNRGIGEITQGTLSGGGLYIGLNSTATLMANTISSNEATSGGGVHLEQSSQVTLTHNTISNNYANLTGGGVYMFMASPTLNSNQIISNTTPSNGGGIFIDDGSSPTLVNNIIARNRADSNGGGIYIDFSTTKPTIINNTIVANNLGPSWANEGIFMFGSPSPTIVNNIIVTHATGIEGTPLTNTLDYNDVWACSSGCYSGVAPGPHDRSFDPRFVTLESGDYHLQNDSPLIDMGTNVGIPTTDFDDEPRLLDGNQDGITIVDIGADEFRPNQIWLPTIFKNYDPRLVEVSGILHAGDACAFCCYPVSLETTSRFYELVAFGLHQYDGLHVSVQGLLQGPCQWSSRQVISVVSIEVLDSPP